MAMSDPRFTDPRNDPRLTPSSESAGGVWGWVAGLAVVALIAFIIIAGWNSSTNTAANNPGMSPAPVTTGSAPVRNVTPPTTTGSGATSPRPAAPQPVSPPANSNTK
jgi:hypothetical protein